MVRTHIVHESLPRFPLFGHATAAGGGDRIPSRPIPKEALKNMAPTGVNRRL